jgi:hypothetical protein
MRCCSWPACHLAVRHGGACHVFQPCSSSALLQTSASSAPSDCHSSMSREYGSSSARSGREPKLSTPAHGAAGSAQTLRPEQRDRKTISASLCPRSSDLGAGAWRSQGDGDRWPWRVHEQPEAAGGSYSPGLAIMSSLPIPPWVANWADYLPRLAPTQRCGSRLGVGADFAWIKILQASSAPIFQPAPPTCRRTCAARLGRVRLQAVLVLRAHPTRAPWWALRGEC